MSKILTFKEKAIKYLLRRRKIDSKTQCWIFIGPTKYQNGYARVEINGKRYFIQRLSLFIWKDFDLNSPLLACHTRECPYRKCFNPDHLYIGTAQNNIDDARELGHLSNGLCSEGHRLIYHKSNDRKHLKGICKICQAKRAKDRRLRIKKQFENQIQL